MKVLDSLALGLLFAAGGFFLAGLLALAFQAQFWFNHGTWQPITVFAAVYGFLPATFLHGSSILRTGLVWREPWNISYSGPSGGY